MKNIDHIMPKPTVVPIFWGHDYLSNPNTATSLQRLIVDLAAGPFMNGLAQYGVQRGSATEPILIDDPNPPKTITYVDSNQQLKDEITKKLLSWIKQGLVPPPSTPNDLNRLYLILPPPETTFQTFNPNDSTDTIGNGIQGWHNSGKTDPGPPPTLFWAIVKTNDVGPPSAAAAFVNGVAIKICHELVEQFVDRNGTFEEIGDPCNSTSVTYRGFNVQQYHSDWDTSPSNKCGCINGDSPVSLKRFLTAINFDFKGKGLSALGTPILNIDFIARTMQTHDSVPVPAPSTCK